MLRDALRSVGEADDWVPWISPIRDQHGELEWDGNPIWSGISPTRHRGFRIIQGEVTDRLIPEISLWFNHNDYDAPALPQDELVLNLSLSEETAPMAALLLRKWVDPSVTLTDMATVVEETLADHESYELPKTT
jgi:hypothetical protein